MERLAPEKLEPSARAEKNETPERSELLKLTLRCGFGVKFFWVVERGGGVG